MSSAPDFRADLPRLVSPHFGPLSPDTIYRAWRAARFEVVTSQTQLEEIRRASRYPKFKGVLQPYRVGTMVNNLQRALVLDVLPGGIEADDPFDAFLLAMAQAGEADYLVTGDHRGPLAFSAISDVSGSSTGAGSRGMTS